MKFGITLICIASLLHALTIFISYNAYVEAGGIAPVIKELGLFYTALLINNCICFVYCYYLGYREWKDEKENGHIY